MRITSTVVAAVAASLCIVTGCSSGTAGSSGTDATPAPGGGVSSSAAVSSGSPTGGSRSAPSSSADAAASSGKYAAARSHPVRDSYYPKHGVSYLDTLHYALKLDWHSKTKKLTGVATIDFRVTTARNTVRFDLGASMHVSSVRLDGDTAKISRTGTHLFVTTPGLQPGARHTVVIDYAGTPKPVPAPASRADVQRLGFRTTVDGAAYTLQEPFGAFTWYPVNDQPADKAFYDATLTAHDGQRGVFNGQVVSSTTKGRTTTTRFHLARPASSYLTTVAFGDYKHETATGPHGLPINYWYTAAAGKKALAIVRKTPQTLKWAEKQLGPYPFASAGVVLVPAPSGMETQTLVTMAQDVAPFGGADIYASDYPHELIHSWFGDEVTPSDWSDLWLNESLTFFMQYRYMKDHHLPLAWGTYAEFQHRQDQQLRDTEGPPGAYDKTKFGGLSEYVSGSLMLHNLEKAYGTRRFNAALKGWPATHRYHNADRADFITYMDKALGPKAGPYIKHWLTAKKTPAPLPKQP